MTADIITADLLADVDVPVLTALQCQGDVAVIPTSGTPGGVPVPAAGIPVVRGENGGHTHTLVGEGLLWAPSDDLLDMGAVTVPAGGVAYLLHPEHAAVAFAEGVWRVRRQREQADEIRRVAD